MCRKNVKSSILNLTTLFKQGPSRSAFIMPKIEYILRQFDKFPYYYRGWLSFKPPGKIDVLAFKLSRDYRSYGIGQLTNDFSYRLIQTSSLAEIYSVIAVCFRLKGFLATMPNNDLNFELLMFVDNILLTILFWDKSNDFKVSKCKIADYELEYIYLFSPWDEEDSYDLKRAALQIDSFLNP